jgi:hypothetical protein
VKLVSNKDGNVGDRGSSFSTPSPNSYSVVSGGGVVGQVEQVPYNLGNINANWSGVGDCWVFYDGEGSSVFASQHLREVRNFIRQL